LSVPWKSIAKYLLAATVMASVLYLLPHPTKLSLTLAATATGGALYLVLLLAIDKESRKLLARILQEIRGYLH
jgi:protein-S-isoprenylcysteine O-methyltransferase Ste14